MGAVLSPLFPHLGGGGGGVILLHALLCIHTIHDFCIMQLTVMLFLQCDFNKLIKTPRNGPAYLGTIAVEDAPACLASLGR